MAKKRVDPDKKIEPVWGPSVPHSWSCQETRELNGRCTCLKQNYCETCDAMHSRNERCPRSVLDDMRDALFYKDELKLDRLVDEVLDAAIARSAAYYGLGQTAHIKGRIDELVRRHGNLGITQKKLYNLVIKEQRRRWRREARNNCPRRWRNPR